MAVRKLLVVLGIPIDDLTLDEAIQRLDEFVQVGRATDRSHQIATVDAQFIVDALGDPELAGILQNADMVTANGRAMLWGARELGVNMQGRTTAAELGPALVRQAAQKGYSVYLLGATQEDAERAAASLKSGFSTLAIAGAYAGPSGSLLELDPTVAEDIRIQRPDLLFVSMKNGEQEKWIAMHLHSVRVPAIIGVGGSFDALIRGAPASRLSLRTAIRFGLQVRRQRRMIRDGGAPSTVLPTSGAALLNGIGMIFIEGRLDRGNQESFLLCAREALEATPFLVVDLARADFLDSSAFGSLVSLTKQARDAGGEMWVTSVPEQIARTLALLRLDRFLEIRGDVQAVFGERAARIARPATTSSTGTRRAPTSAPNVNGGRVVTMPRRFDAATAPQVLQECSDALTPDGWLILDFSSTVFLASAGMAVMVQLQRLAKERGGEVRVAGCSPDVQRTLKLTRLDSVLPLYPSIAAAQN
jgi:N-acetylglucosaminyldiphosphoundecaprenol N-acetyl-beta-D-mannosaminyltransferase